MKRLDNLVSLLFRRNKMRQRETEFLGYEAYLPMNAAKVRPPVKSGPAEPQHRKAA